MKPDDHFELPKGDFIPGIFNYCNRWCERCIYTDKCGTFAMEKDIRHEIEKKKKREKSMEENKSFWDQVNKTIEEAAELIDEEVPLIKNDWSTLFGEEEDDEGANEAMKDHEENRERAKAHDISRVSFKYKTEVMKWFEEREDILKQEFVPDTKDFNVSYPGIVDETELKHLKESVEVIQWYTMQIYIKVMRALSSSYEEEEDKEMFEGFPKDSEGSAMVFNGYWQLNWRLDSSP